MDSQDKRRKNLKPFVKGDPRCWREGRPKKLVSKLVAYGYTQNESYDVMKSMIGLTVQELKAIADSKDGEYDVAEITIATNLLKDIKIGRMTTMVELWNRIYGQATKKVQDVTPEQPLFTEIKKDVSEDNGDK